MQVYALVISLVCVILLQLVHIVHYITLRRRSPSPSPNSPRFPPRTLSFPCISISLSLSHTLQNRELEICVRLRDNDGTVLAGLIYLRLEDYLDASSTTFCLPLEPQGILLAEVRPCHTPTGLSSLLTKSPPTFPNPLYMLTGIMTRRFFFHSQITYEIPRTERRPPKLKRGKRIFRSKCSIVHLCSVSVIPPAPPPS